MELNLKNNSLEVNNGLSLSQAQSVSNLCNQKAREIQNRLNVLNNFSKSVEVGVKTHPILSGNKMPKDIVSILEEKSRLHACQAFLIENIKAKDLLIRAAKSERADTSMIVFPILEKLKKPTNVLAVVDEKWGWNQLTKSEVNEFLEVEAYASHIGQFIHDGSKLDTLRKELPTIPLLEWMEVEVGKKSPVTITTHNKAEDLLKIHEELAGIHRKYEQRVNYFKAKVKNSVTIENGRIAKHNADLLNKYNLENNKLKNVYDSEYELALSKLNDIENEFESKRHETIKAIAQMRIVVDERFQKTIDGFLDSFKKEKK